MANQKGSSKTDTFVKLILVFFISLLSFSIGTFVGKKFSDNQHQLALLEPGSHADRDVASIPESDHEVTPKKALNDDDIAKLAEEFVTDEEAGHHPKMKEEQPEHKDSHSEVAKNEGHGAAAAATKPEAAHHAEAPAAAQRAATRVAANKTGTEPAAKVVDSERSRIPSSLPAQVAQSSTGKFTVQVASFMTEGEAKKHAEGLRAKGLEQASYIQAQAKGATVFRVIVGLFATQDEAKKSLPNVKSKANISDVIIQKIQ
jgi:cell division septation protein DedD